MNPCTLGWYLPLLVQGKDGDALLQPSEPANGQRPSPLFPSSAVSANKGAASQDNPKSDAGSTSDTPESYPQPSKKRAPSQWETLDAQFRRGLPDKAYAGRLAYRGLVMRACPRIKMLDDVRVTEKEKKKAEGLLRRVLEEVEASNSTIRPPKKK